MDPLIQRHRDEILRVADRHGARRVYVFGSRARGTATAASDLDLLVETGPARSFFFPGGLIADLEALLGCRVEVVTEAGLHPALRTQVLEEAVPPVKDDRLYLAHILDAIARIERYTTAGAEAFYEDEQAQDATLRNLQTLAESTQRLSESLKVHHPEIDWRGIAGFRNVLVHNYLGLDPAQVWDVVAYDLPLLKAAVVPMLNEARPG